MASSVDKLRTDPPDKQSGGSSQTQNTVASSSLTHPPPLDDRSRLAALNNGNPKYRPPLQQQQHKQQQQQQQQQQQPQQRHTSSARRQRDDGGISGGGGGGDGVDDESKISPNANVLDSHHRHSEKGEEGVRERVGAAGNFSQGLNSTSTQLQDNAQPSSSPSSSSSSCLPRHRPAQGPSSSSSPSQVRQTTALSAVPPYRGRQGVSPSPLSASSLPSSSTPSSSSSSSSASTITAAGSRGRQTPSSSSSLADTTPPGYVVDHKIPAGCSSGSNSSSGCRSGNGSREATGIKQQRESSDRNKKNSDDNVFTADRRGGRGGGCVDDDVDDEDDDDKASTSCFAPSALKGFVDQGRECFSSSGPRSSSSPRFAKYRRQQRVRTPSDDVAIIDIESHDDGSEDATLKAAHVRNLSSSGQPQKTTTTNTNNNSSNSSSNNNPFSNTTTTGVSSNTKDDHQRLSRNQHGSRAQFYIGSEDSEKTEGFPGKASSTRRGSLNETTSVLDSTTSSQGQTEDLDTTAGSDDITTAEEVIRPASQVVEDEKTTTTTTTTRGYDLPASLLAAPPPKGEKSKRKKIYQRRANATPSSKKNFASGLFSQRGKGACGAELTTKGNDSQGEDNGSGGSTSSKPAPRRIAKRGIGMLPSSNWRRLRNTLKAANEMQTPKKQKHLLTREDSFLKRFSTRNHQTQNSSNLTDEESPRSEQPEVKIGSKFVIQHDGNFMFYWLAVVTVSVMYNLWTCIARQAFREIQTGCPACWFSIDALFDIIYISDIIVQFRTGYLDQGLVVYDSRKLRDRYIKSRGIYIDVACLVPLDLLQLYIGIHPMIRFPRFLKIYRAFRFLHMLESRTAYPNLIRVASLTHILFLGAHWFAAFYYMISEAEGFTGGWAYPPPVGINADVTRKYLKSLYWSTLTLTTIGDLPQPEKANEYVFVIVSYLIGVFVFATIVGQVGNVINNRNASRQEFERLLDGAKIYMQTHNVPHNLQKRVQRWYDYVWSRGRLNGCDINSLGLLPDKLKTELAIHVNLETLKKVTIFQECQPEFLHDLVLKMKAYIFTPGDLICRRGEVAREMFIIADGVVEIISETGVMLKRMGAGDFFGEIGILNLDGGINRRSADVRSVGYLELFVLSREDVLGALKDHPEAESIIRDYGQRRLREMEAHRQRVKPVKCQDSSDDQSSTSQIVQNRLLKTLRSLSPAVRRQSAQMHVRSQSTQSGHHPNPGSPGANQKPGSASLRCVVPPHNCIQGPVSAGGEGLFKSSFQGGGGGTTDSSDDTSGEVYYAKNRQQQQQQQQQQQHQQQQQRQRSGYISSIYNRLSGLFRRKVGHRRSLGVYDPCAPTSKYYSPSKESYTNDNNSSLQSSPLHSQGGRKCSVTVNVESCSDNEYKGDGDMDNSKEIANENKNKKKTFSKVHHPEKIVDYAAKDVHSSLDGEMFQSSPDVPDMTSSQGLGTKLVQVFQGKLKSSSVSYMPVCSDDLDEKVNNNIMYDKPQLDANELLSQDNSMMVNLDGEKNIEVDDDDDAKCVFDEKFQPRDFKDNKNNDRPRTRSFTGDRYSKSALNSRRVRALQLACVRFSLDSCDCPSDSSSVNLGDRGLSSESGGGAMIGDSRALSDNVFPDHQTDAASAMRPSCHGMKDAARSSPSAPLVYSYSCPTKSQQTASYSTTTPSPQQQTFSNPDVSFFSSGGTELKIQSSSGNSDTCLGETFPNPPAKALWKPSPIPPLVPPSTKGAFHGRSQDANCCPNFTIIESLQNPNGVILGNIGSRPNQYRNRFNNDDGDDINSQRFANSSSSTMDDAQGLYRNTSCNATRCNGTVANKDNTNRGHGGSSGYPLNSNTSGSSSVYNRHNNHNSNHNHNHNHGHNHNNNNESGFDGKYPPGDVDVVVCDTAFVDTNLGHLSCHCDPVVNFHQFVGKHLPEALCEQRDKPVGQRQRQRQPSDSHWYADEEEPDMTEPGVTGSKLNTEASCARFRRSSSLPSILDAFAVMTPSTPSPKHGDRATRRRSTHDTYCWSSDDARRLDPKFKKSRFSEESVSCRSMDRDGSGKWGRSQAMSIIQTPAADMAYLKLSEQIHVMQDLLDKRLSLLEEANASSSIKLERLANSHDALLRMFKQQVSRQDSSSSRAPLLSPEDDGMPASCV